MCWFKQKFKFLAKKIVDMNTITINNIQLKVDLYQDKNAVASSKLPNTIKIEGLKDVSKDEIIKTFSTAGTIKNLSIGSAEEPSL